MSVEESLKCLSLDYLNLLVNSQTFTDVTFSVEGRLVHAHRCVLVARSHFFRKLFCGTDPPPLRSSPAWSGSRGGGGGGEGGQARGSLPMVIPVDSVSYEVFMLVLQFLYSGHVLLVPQKHEQRPDCHERSCWHTHCSSAINLALGTLAAARLFGVEQLVILAEKQLANMVEKASIDDVMKVLLASHRQDLNQLWTTCSHLVAKSGLPPSILARHLPPDVVAKLEQLRSMGSSLSRAHSFPFAVHHHPSTIDLCATTELEEQQKLRRMRRALDSSDVELVRLMVMGEGLNLDEALALHYAVEHCSREVVKALLELGAADVNHHAGPTGKTPLHLAAEMVNADMVSVLLDHHADPSARTIDGVTPLDILRNLTSEFLFRGAVPGLTHIEPNKLRLCLELVQSAIVVLSREEAINESSNQAAIHVHQQPLCTDITAMHGRSSTASGNGGGSAASRSMLYLDLGMAAGYHPMAGCQTMNNDGEESDVAEDRSHGCGAINQNSIYSPRDFH